MWKVFQRLLRNNRYWVSSEKAVLKSSTKKDGDMKISLKLPLGFLTGVLLIIILGSVNIYSINQ